VGELLVVLLAAPAGMVAMLGLEELERRLPPAAAGRSLVPDVEQPLCVSVALWDGRDPIVKERALRGPGGPE